MFNDWSARTANLCAAFGIAVALLAGADSARAAPAGPKALRRTTFTLDGMSFAMPVPDRGNVRVSADTFTIFVGTRLQRLITLEKSKAGSRRHYRQKTVLANGLRLEYSIDDNVGGGSGGTIAELKGRLEINGHVLSVLCTDQSEFSAPQADWCLSYLGQLELTKSGR